MGRPHRRTVAQSEQAGVTVSTVRLRLLAAAALAVLTVSGVAAQAAPAAQRPANESSPKPSGSHSVGEVQFSAAGPVSLTVDLLKGESLVSGAFDPFRGPADVSVSTAGRWSYVQVQDSAHRIVFAMLTDPRVWPDRLILSSWDAKPLRAGRYVISAVGEKPLAVTFAITGSRRQLHPAATTPADLAYRVTMAHGLPTGAAAVASAKQKITRTRPVTLLTFQRQTAGVFSSSSTCFAGPDGTCRDGDGRSLDTGVGSSSSASVGLRTYPGVQPGQYSVTADFESVGAQASQGVAALLVP
jgi:hypothetical protein